MGPGWKNVMVGVSWKHITYLQAHCLHLSTSCYHGVGILLHEHNSLPQCKVYKNTEPCDYGLYGHWETMSQYHSSLFKLINLKWHSSHFKERILYFSVKQSGGRVTLDLLSYFSEINVIIPYLPPFASLQALSYIPLCSFSNSWPLFISNC